MPEAIQLLVDRLGGRRRALILATGAATALFILGLSRWATAPTWVPVFSGLPLEAVGQMTDRLEEAGIKYRLDQGGAELMVPAADLARARVVLAREGLPASGRPGLELFDQPSWGMTDFTQRVNYRRALEGELERTIGKMRGVESAQVHLTLHESSGFRRADRPAEASVVVKLRGGITPPQDVVQGIAHLVASSVDGLDSEHVTVLDDAGRLLSAPDEPGSIAGLTNRQLKAQREVESYLEARAEQLVSQIVGGGNARVQVSASINFDRVERTTQTVDPDRQALTTEQRAEIVPGKEGGAASANVASSYENSRTLENFSGATGNVKRLTVAVLVNDKVTAPADSTAPPVVTPRSPEELTRIETLVRSAIGIDEGRGDVISVVSIPFDGTAGAKDGAAEEKRDVWAIVQTAQRPAITMLGFVLAFVIALLVIRSLRTPLELPAGAMTPALPSAPGAPVSVPGAAPVTAIPIANSAVRDRAAATIEQHPDVAARLVRGWLKE